MSRLSSLVTLVLAASLSGAEATTVEPLSLDEMIQRAGFIFVGKAKASRADWNADHTQIYTYVTFEVDRFLKGGSTDREVTLRLFGGRVGDFAALVPGTPQFAPGEDVLLFCVGQGPRTPTVLGLALGKFTIATDARGERILKRDISGLVLANYRTDSRSPGEPVTRYLLTDVESHIRSLTH